jgi:hypothetical protein
MSMPLIAVAPRLYLCVQERFVLCMAACALYVAGMPEQRGAPSSSTTATSAPGDFDTTASGGSCVSLTQLLRATHIRYLSLLALVRECVVCPLSNVRAFLD